MSARWGKPFSTLLHCNGDQESEVLAELSAADCEWIERTFWLNICSGRAQTMRERTARSVDVSGQPSSGRQTSVSKTWSDAEKLAWLIGYVQKIARIYRQERHQFRSLEEGDIGAWSALHARLTHDLSLLLTKLGVPADSIPEVAAEIAHHTCGQIAMQRFPCDVPFSGWVHSILSGQLLQRLTATQKPLAQSLPDALAERRPLERLTLKELAPIDSSSLPDGDLALQAPPQTKEIELLADAISQLPTLQQRIIILYSCYFGLSDEQLVYRMDMCWEEVQALRHDALRRLQGIIGR